MELYYFRS